jgi:DNA helicase-2/ATP-dependent DNA helicase PcrA
MDRNWSRYQTAVFDHIQQRIKNNLIVEAKPGSGKTTTIVKATEFVPKGKSVLMCAFNVKIRDELERRVPSSVKVRTFHALGLYAVQRSRGKVEVAKYRQKDLIKRVIPAHTHGVTRAYSDVSKIVSMAMNRLAKTDDEILEIMDTYDCYPDLPAYEGPYVEWAQEVLRLTREPSKQISYDDMIYLPAYFSLAGSKFDYVFVDEAQDCNPAQLQIVKNALKPGGKLIAVGDRRQAIYGFRGADSHVMQNLESEFSADVLPLSITYRCPKSVVRLVNFIVPDLEAAPSAAEGRVVMATENQFLQSVRPGDVVISRTNAAIASYSMKLLVSGVPCTIIGKDISSGLLKLIDKNARDTTKDFLKALSAAADEERTHLIDIKKEDKAEELEDQVSALFGLSEGCAYTHQLRARILELFSDEEGAAPQKVIFSTVHKAKGLEFNRVWMFETTFNTHSVEGENLYFVAATRTIEELFLVQIPRRDGKPPRSAATEWRADVSTL